MDGTMMHAGDDPGAVDNRLTIDPNGNWGAKVTAWEDGEEYDVKLRIRQLAPGEFEVISLTSYGDTEAPEPETEDAAEEEALKTPEAKMSKAPRGMINPAVQAMLGHKR